MTVETDWLDPEVYGAGWVEAPDLVDRICGAQPIPDFEDSPAGSIGVGELPDTISLHDAAVKVLGRPLPIRHQGAAGTCVGFGVTRAVELALLWQIAFGGESFAFPEKGLAQEPTYGGSRVEIGKRVFGRGDGSGVAMAFEFVKQWGVCARQPYPQFGFDLSEYSIPLSRDWGWNGVPDRFEPTLRLHPVKAIARVTTTDGLAKALAQGYGAAQGSRIMIGSRKDANGVTNTYRWGGHCMTYAGYFHVNGKRYFQVDNSHGPGAHRGGQHPRFPYDGGAAISDAEVQQQLNARDSMVCSSVVGFPARDAIDFGLIG